MHNVKVHADYEYNCEKWERARDVVAGEDAVKGKGELYLPKLVSQEPSEYNAYKARAKFFGATGRTVSGLHGLMFRKETVINRPPALDPFVADCNLKGKSLAEYSKDVAKEMLKVGRGGTLVDWSEDENRAFLAYYKAEDVCDWEVNRVAGKSVLVRVVLADCVVLEPTEAYDPNKEDADREQEQLLVLQLVPFGDGMVYTVERWVERKERKGKKTEWVLEETRMPVRQGTPLDFIPFVFHNADGTDDCCCPPPLEDIISVNLHQYRLSADYNHALHFSACPTAWVAGFHKEADLKLGSSTAWVTDQIGASAGFLEFHGHGLEPIRNALKDDQQEMAILGARLLEEQKRDSEAAETVRLRQTGESSVLVNIADSISKALTKVVKVATWWMRIAVAGESGGFSDISDDAASVNVNKDFVESHMSPQELTALVSSWIQGAFSRDTLLFNLRRGEVLPPDVTDEEEKSKVEGDSAVVADMMAARKPPVEKAGAAA